MLPGSFNIKFSKGKTVSMGFSGKMEDGQTLTFDSYTDIVLTVRQPWVQAQEVEATPLLVLKKSTGFFTISGDGTSFDINLTKEYTGLIPFSEGRYELDLVTDDVIVDPFLKGKFTVLGPEDA